MAKQKQDDQPEQEEAPRYSREAACREVLAEMDGERTLTELTQQAEKLIIDGGGKANPDATEWQLWSMLQTLEACKVVELVNSVRRIKK